jgi:hypothetical protein
MCVLHPGNTLHVHTLGIDIDAQGALATEMVPVIFVLWILVAVVSHPIVLMIARAFRGDAKSTK